MKLNYDCVRDILLVLEEESDFGSIVLFDSEHPHGLESKYSLNEVLYHLRFLNESDMLYKAKIYSYGYAVQDLSPAGHKFLEEIRSNTNWNKTKSIASQVGVSTLDSLKTIASSLATSAIRSYLNL